MKTPTIAVIRDEGYILVREFLAPQECLAFANDVAALIADTYHTSDRATLIRERKIYPPNDQETRRSFGFVFPVNGAAQQGLPFLPSEILGRVAKDIFRAVEDVLGLTEGRVLFNVQQYKNGATPLPLHYDGEFFDVHAGVGGELVLREGIRPEFTSVLTLSNSATAHSGTVLHNQNGDITIDTKAGDLLLFDNVNYLHRTTSFVSENRSSDVIRHTVGWRSLETNCFHHREGFPLGRLTFHEAIALHLRHIGLRVRNEADPVPF